MKKIFIASLFLLLAVLPEASAQKFLRTKRYTSVGASINAMNYFGDVTPSSSFTSTDIELTRYNFSVFAIRRFGPRFSARVNFAWGRLRGDDAVSANPTDEDGKFRFARNLHFRNDIKELSVVAMFDLFANRNTFLKRPDFVPYGFVGIAGFHHNPRAQAPGDGSWVDLRPLKTEGVSYNSLQLAIPAGIGFRYKLSPKLDIGLELGYRYTFFDYLDDVSREYVGSDNLGSEEAARLADRTGEADFTQIQGEGLVQDIDPIYFFPSIDGFGLAGEQRGKSSEKDWYLITGFHISYILMPGVRCPKFR